MFRMTRVVSLLLCQLVLGPALARSAAPRGERSVLPCSQPASLAEVRVLGPADPALPMERMVLVLKAGPEAEGRLARFLADLQDPGSAGFHRWLTPDQFGARFGPSPDAVAEVTGWLQDQGFGIDSVSPGRKAITFSGDVARVQQAFATAIVSYEAEGAVRHTNTLAPSVPRFLADRVEGLVALNGGRRRALNTGFRPLSGKPGLSLFGLHFLAPGDFAAIYNTRPLYAQGIDGAGVAIAVVGRTHISLTDAKMFRWLYGLPANPPVLVQNGPDAGDQGAAENGEADLDVEWAGAVAPKAGIKLVVSKSTAATDGVDLSAQYIVDHNLAPVMTVSFGACEKELGRAGVAFYRNLWAQASAQGITVVVASGDTGAAGCPGPSQSAAPTAGVSALASTPSNVALGGTQFADGTGSDWSFWSGKGGVSAKGYIPEVAWNESGSLLLGLGSPATGGGPSAVHAKPAWQKGLGVPEDGMRDIPDLSLAADMANGYLIQTGGLPNLVGGTSCAAPAFAGIMALVVQRTGQRQGNPNPALYRMAAAQPSGQGPQVFHDILLGDNSVPGTKGYPCGPGFDLATGLGSVDAKALVEAWN